MPTKERYHREGGYKKIPRMLSPEDKVFIQLVSKGMMRAKAFREAYPDQVNVKKFMDMKNQNVGGEELRKIRTRIQQHAKDKLQAKHIASALVTYQNRMDEFSDHSLDTAIDLVQNARSEKVRADLAIEGMRQRVGTPVTKVAVQEKKTVTLTFARPENVIDLDVEDEI